MTKPFHPYHAIQEICDRLSKDENFNTITLKMAASTGRSSVSFIISRLTTDPIWCLVAQKSPTALILHGTCFNTLIVLGVGHRNRVEFDLIDPDSILRIEQVLRSNVIWEVPRV